MTGTNRPLARAKTWAASALLAATVGTAAIGYHLADSAAQTVAAGTTTTTSSAGTSSGSTGTSRSSGTGFGSTSAPSSSSGQAQTRTNGS